MILMDNMFKPLKLSELVSEIKMYSYPIDYETYSPEEVVKLVEFYALIEDANEGKVNKEELIKKYNEFRKMLNSISIEKQIDKEFEKVSGYSIYKTIKKFK